MRVARINRSANIDPMRSLSAAWSFDQCHWSPIDRAVIQGNAVARIDHVDLRGHVEVGAGAQNQRWNDSVEVRHR